MSDVVRALGWGVLLGGVVGFAAGLLAAPEEGRKLRRRATFRLQNLAKQVAELSNQLKKPETDSEERRHGAAVVADACERAENINRDIDALVVDLRRQESSAQ